MLLPRQALIAQFRHFFPYLAPDQRHIPLLTVCILGIAFSNTALIWLAGQPFNHLTGEDYAALTESLLWLALIAVLNQGFHFCSTLMSNWLGLRLVGRLRGHLMGVLMRLGFPVVQKLDKGDLLSRTSRDVDKVQELLVELPSLLVSHVATTALYGVMLFWLDPQLALIAVALLLLFLLHYMLFARRKKSVSRRFLQENASLLTLEEETLSNLRGINSYTAEQSFKQRHGQRFGNSFVWAMKARWLDTAFHVSFSALIFLCAISIVYFGVQQIRAEDIQLGTLVAFLLYLGYLAIPLRGIAQSSYSAQEALASCHRVEELLQLRPPLEDDEHAPTLQVGSGGLEFRHVGFAYDNQGKLIDDLNLRIQPGSTVAIVGPSGAGKSSLAYLLMRFYDPQQGEILIDGQNIKQVRLSSLRQHIAAVWQSPFLFSDSIRNNLLLADAQATEAQLMEACKSAHAWEFIQKLDKGLDTLIGANGTQLSTGQQQRLSIAQAFLRDAPILILDEASSALDSQAEEKLMQAVAQMRKHQTTLIIGHRYSSLKLADVVIYLNNDGSINTGTHEELMQTHTGYRDAVHWQTNLSSP